MNTYSWSIADLIRNSNTGRVDTVFLKCTGTSADGQFSADYIFETDLEGEIVTPFEDLTEDQVVQWARDVLGEAEESVTLNIDMNIENQQQLGVSVNGFPWS